MGLLAALVQQQGTDADHGNENHEYQVDHRVRAPSLPCLGRSVLQPNRVPRRPLFPEIAVEQTALGRVTEALLLTAYLSLQRLGTESSRL